MSGDRRQAETAAPTGNGVAGHQPVLFWATSLVIAMLLGAGALWPEGLNTVFATTQSWVVGTFGWFYLLMVTGLLFAVVYLMCSRHGDIRLGRDDTAPEFGYLTWIAMLFSAGMGIGLMFFAVAEPMIHYASPPDARAYTVEAANDAMAITFFHWGLHAWAIYAIVGLSMAYFSFRRGYPLSLKHGLHRLFGGRMPRSAGYLVDVLSVCATLFGIATSLGLGVLQINAGLSSLSIAPQSVWVQMLLIAVSIGLTILSVATGLTKGMRLLSELNMVLAMVLMLAVLVLGPTGFLFDAFTENIGNYLSDLVPRGLQTHAYGSSGWMAQWTLFYWAWWISWSPFVGLFIARISRGRSIREFVAGVLFVPTLLCFVWMTVFGNSAIFLDRGVAAGAISGAVGQDIAAGLFLFFEYLPGGLLLSGLALVLVLLFFVTSADSGAYVIDMVVSGGDDSGPAWRRVYWCLCIGLAAGILLYSGGLGTLQAATLITALPFSMVLLLLALGLLYDLAKTGGRN